MRNSLCPRSRRSPHSRFALPLLRCARQDSCQKRGNVEGEEGRQGLAGGQTGKVGNILGHTKCNMRSIIGGCARERDLIKSIAEFSWDLP